MDLSLRVFVISGVMSVLFFFTEYCLEKGYSLLKTTLLGALIGLFASLVLYFWSLTSSYINGEIEYTLYEALIMVLFLSSIGGFTGAIFCGSTYIKEKWYRD